MNINHTWKEPSKKEKNKLKRNDSVELNSSSSMEDKFPTSRVRLKTVCDQPPRRIERPYDRTFLVSSHRTPRKLPERMGSFLGLTKEEMGGVPPTQKKLLPNPPPKPPHLQGNQNEQEKWILDEKRERFATSPMTVERDVIRMKEIVQHFDRGTSLQKERPVLGSSRGLPSVPRSTLPQGEDPQIPNANQQSSLIAELYSQNLFPSQSSFIKLNHLSDDDSLEGEIILSPDVLQTEMRRPTLNDQDDICALISHCVEDNPKLTRVLPPIQLLYQQCLEKNINRVFQYQSKVVAFVSLSADTTFQNRYIKCFCVDPLFRGRTYHIAQKLMEESIGIVQFQENEWETESTLICNLRPNFSGLKLLSLNGFSPFQHNYLLFGKPKDQFLSTQEQSRLKTKLTKAKFNLKVSIRKMTKSDIQECFSLCQATSSLVQINQIEEQLEYGVVIIDTQNHIVGYTSGFCWNGHSVAQSPEIFQLLALFYLLNVKKNLPYCFLLSQSSPVLSYFLQIEALTVIESVSFWARGSYLLKDEFYPPLSGFQ